MLYDAVDCLKDFGCSTNHLIATLFASAFVPKGRPISGGDMGITKDVLSVEDFQAFVAANKYVAVFLWAQWSEPSRLLQEALDEVMASISKLCCAKVNNGQQKIAMIVRATRRLHHAAPMPVVRSLNPCNSTYMIVLQVDVDRVPAVRKHLNVSSVPTVVFLRNGDAVSTVEGFEPAALFEQAEEAVAEASHAMDLDKTLERLTTQQPVMLFMKGTPQAPRCGFSRRVVEALDHSGIKFGHFDILSNEEVQPLLSRVTLGKSHEDRKCLWFSVFDCSSSA